VTIQELKRDILDVYAAHLDASAKTVAAQKASHQEKAKRINALIAEKQQYLIEKFARGETTKERQQTLLVIQYCTSVVSLEYRHMVWPYEYMALSRRVGELWERFCCAAWDQPSRVGVKRIAAPSFADVAIKLRYRLHEALADNTCKNAIADIEILFELVGEINMKEDEMFLVDGIPYIIDFKSGFGSNEKGNTLRLQTVGRAYKLWNPNTQLLLLVRQEQNNNYLNVIKRSGLWDVRCGEKAYATIDELTGSNIIVLRKEAINFESDLSKTFWSDLSSHLSDLTSYLQW